MKKILLTGSTGFIISNLIRRIVYEKQPYTIASIDNASNKSTLNNIYFNKIHQFYLADITDAHMMDVIFQLEKPDIVLHGAASTFVDASITNPNRFINDNVLGTQIIINSCVKWNVEKLVYIGTDEIYGHLENEQEPSWTEESPLNPRNPYSASKASGELLVKAAAATYGLKYNITRSCNNYGPRQTFEKLIPKIIKCINENTKIPIYGKGAQIRDWMHVFDNCAGLLKVLEKGADNETYNISAGQEISNLELVNEICNIMDKGHSLINFVSERIGHDFRYSINSDKLKALGWATTFKLKPGLRNTIEWYQNNQWALR